MTLTRGLTSGLIGGLTAGLVSGSVGATLWKPTDLSSLIGWWDASDDTTISETTTSGRVAQWDDKSGNANHLYVSSSVNEPDTGSTSLNSLNTIQFGDNGANYLSPDGAITGAIAAVDAQDIAIHMVVRQHVDQSTGAIVCLKNSTGSDFITTSFGSSGQNAYFAGDGTSYLLDSTFAFTRGTAYLVGFDANASDVIAYKNGALLKALGSAASSNIFDRFIIGRRNGSGLLWKGEIAEIVCSGALSTADRQAVEGYLSDKWGV